MELLAFIRHGTYNNATGDLDANGINQATKIANLLRNLNPTETIIIYSPVKRTFQTATEISRIMNSPTTKEDSSIASDASSFPDIAKATTNIEEQCLAFKNILVIGHADSINEIALFFHKKILGTNPNDPISLSKGQFYLIDALNKESHLI